MPPSCGGLPSRIHVLDDLLRFGAIVRLDDDLLTPWSKWWRRLEEGRQIRAFGCER